MLKGSNVGDSWKRNSEQKGGSLRREDNCKYVISPLARPTFETMRVDSHSQHN